jgi:hypothetical protein
MNALITETCRIAWWKGYVKGRFVAVLESEARQPEVVGESPSWRWPGSTPPEPTDEARHALDALTDKLVASGWTLEPGQPEVWYERVLTRPAIALAAVPDELDEPGAPDEAPDLRVVAAEEPRESQAVARLRSELLLALDEVERQQRLRNEAEDRARRAATRRDAVPPAAHAADWSARPGRRHALWIVLELASVVAVAAIFLLLLDSTYAAVVAGLTAGAVVLALDSLFAVRSGRAAPPREPASVTLLSRR